MGAFKFRGAYNKIAKIDQNARRNGVVAYSSGNHAQGVALAGSLLGAPATIVMPYDAPSSKIDATREYGAQIVFYDRHRSHRAEIAQGLAQERGAALVPPYDDPDIIAGAGTAALEMLQDAPGLDAIVTPVGGGGLLSGTALAAAELAPHAALYGVEPEAGNDVQQSLARGEIVHIPVPATIADGLQTTAPGTMTFPILRRFVESVVTVSDVELRDAMRFAFERMKMVVEPSGAAALAALMFHKIERRHENVGIVISGGNVDSERFRSLLAAC